MAPAAALLLRLEMEHRSEAVAEVALAGTVQLIQLLSFVRARVAVQVVVDDLSLHRCWEPAMPTAAGHCWEGAAIRAVGHCR